MLFAVHWSFGAGTRNEANARFKETGGPPPPGVKMIGRWHYTEGGEGVEGAGTAPDAAGSTH